MCIDTGTKTPKIETQTEAKKKKNPQKHFN